MKKLSIILLVTMLLSIGFSCSDSFLTKEPLGATSENVFYNAKGIDALLLGCYSMIRGSALWDVSWGASIQNWTYGSVASDDAYKGSTFDDQVPVNDIERWEVTPTQQYSGEKWRLCLGMGVDRCNKTIRVINKSLTDKTITDDQAKQAVAEARFLRALFYFELRLVFGDYVPILKEDTPDPSKVSNTNAAGAVLKFITDDLAYAASVLPDAAKADPIGKPTKYSALALEARAYLQDLNYAAAKPLLDAIINSGKFSLMPKFIDNFNIATNNNAESLFEIQANVNDINESLNAEMGIGLNWPQGGDIGMCCGFHQTSQNLTNAYKVDASGLPLFDTFDNTDFKNDQGIASTDNFVPDDQTPVDPRLDFTVSRRGIPYKDWGINRGKDWVRSQTNAGPYMPAPKPFFKKAERYTLSTTTGWQTGINANNYRYLRYSHVLLWRAEVAASEGDLGKARDLVNMIRTRAGNDKVMGKCKVFALPATFYPFGATGDVDFTLPAANYKIGNYTSFANANDAMRAVQWEDRLEFATEGMRFFDLRRWDNLPNKIGGKSMADVLNAFATSDQRTRDFMKGANFSNKDKYMPVPQTQIDLQPGVLTQNPDYK